LAQSAAAALGGRFRGEDGDGGDLGGGEVVPVQAGGAPLGFACDDFAGGDDEVDAEVVFGFGDRLVDDLEWVDGGDDDGAGADPPGFLEQRDLDVGVARALAQPGAAAVDRHAADDHQVHLVHVLDGDLAGVTGGRVPGWRPRRVRR